VVGHRDRRHPERLHCGISFADLVGAVEQTVLGVEMEMTKLMNRPLPPFDMPQWLRDGSGTMRLDRPGASSFLGSVPARSLSSVTLDLSVDVTGSSRTGNGHRRVTMRARAAREWRACAYCFMTASR
jgi:hypothetical protein